MTKKKKAWIWLVSSLCAVVIAAGAVWGIIYAVKVNSFDLSDAVINNVASYSTLAAGTTATSSSGTAVSARKVAYATSEGATYSNAKLVGGKDNGSFDEITFRKNNKLVGQDWKLHQMQAFGRFIFITYLKTEATNSNDQFYVFYNEVLKTYIIDSTTGKVYSAQEMSKVIDSININNSCYSDNYAYLYAYTASTQANDIYRISIQNDKLVFEEFVDHNYINFLYSELFVDKYDTLYLTTSNGAIGVTKNKTVKNYNTSVKLAINGIVYNSIYNQRVDENGDLVVSTDTVSNALYKATLISTDGNIQYYIYNNISYDTTSSTLHFYVYKVTWLGDVNYNVEEIDLMSGVSSYKDYVGVGTKVFFLNGSSVYSVDIVTKEVEDVAGGYIFNSIANSCNGNVIFTAVDSNMGKVNGLIKPDGTVDISVNNKYTILYIAPLN